MPKHTLLSLALAVLVSGLGAAPARAGGDPIFFAGTSWDGLALVAVKIPSVGKAPGLLDMQLSFGPLAVPALGDGEFLLVLEDGMNSFQIEGTYVLDTKGVPVLSPDLAALETEMLDLLVYVCEQVLFLGSECEILDGVDLVFDPTKVKFKLKGRAEDGFALVQIAGKLPFLVVIPGDDSPAKVGFSLKGVAESPL